MKKFLSPLVVLLVGISFSNLVNAEEPDNAEEPTYVQNGAYLTREIDSSEVEIYDEQGNLLDNTGIKLIEYIPTIQSRSTIYKKYVTTSFSYSTSIWPNSHYLRWSGGWQGTVYYKSYSTMSTLWGTSYSVKYGGTLYRWDV
ncbi:hypothetical protein ACWN6Y_10815 [Vagococcus teuberi]